MKKSTKNQNNATRITRIRARKLSTDSNNDILTVDSIKMYLKAIGRVPLLTAEQEKSLARKIEVGKKATEKINQLRSMKEEGKEISLAELRAEHRKEQTGLNAKQELTEANLRLVVSIAKKYIGRGMTLLDLIQEGNIGLIKAVDKFNYKKGNKFSTYAT